MKKIFFIFLIFQIIIYKPGLFCNPILDNVYIHSDFKKLKIHDIGVVIFNNRTNYKIQGADIASLVTNQFITQLNKKGWYVIHNLKEEDLVYPKRLSKIDAVFEGEILEYRNYGKLRFGIKLSFVYLDTNETIWSAQEIFDASQSKIVKSVKKYYADKIEKDFPLTGYRLYLISMDKFLEFVFDSVIEKLQ